MDTEKTHVCVNTYDKSACERLQTCYNLQQLQYTQHVQKKLCARIAKILTKAYHKFLRKSLTYKHL